ncbi:MAG TPA: flagellar motor switch protein FliG [Parvularculaceae bacterium]|nr:flagellar motor switch protein FliG [Parvularculaceae bacterium]
MTARTILSADDLTGAERAAVVMLALGEEASKPLWASFDEDELRDVSLAISKLGSVASEVVESLLYDFVTNLSSTGAISGSAASAQRFLRNVLPADKAESILEDIKGPAGKTMWDKLANVNERVLSGYLRNEHPQTVAVILSRVKPDHAAKVIAAMPPLFAEEVIARMLSLGPVQKEVLDQIELTLRTEFMAALTRGQDRDPYDAVAEIFNNFDRTTERRFMEALEMKNPGAAERIRSLMFVFEDLVRLDAQDMQTLLRFVDKSDLALALKGAAENVAAHFFANMSERATSILRDDIEIMGPVRVKEVDQAQHKIVETAKQLAEDGSIFLSKSDEEELVY